MKFCNKCEEIIKKDLYEYTLDGLEVCRKCYDKEEKYEPLKLNKKEDIINKPNHYHQGGLDMHAIMEMKYQKEFSEGFYVGNALKYILRYQHKNGLEDIKKAIRNLEKYVALVEKN